jgi:hypothetical protein
MLGLQPELALRKTPIDLGDITEEISAVGSISETVKLQAEEIYLLQKVTWENSTSYGRPLRLDLGCGVGLQESQTSTILVNHFSAIAKYQKTSKSRFE